MILTIPETFKVLIVDDEPDIHAVTRLSLRGVSYGGRNCEIMAADTGVAAVEMMRDHQDIAVIILDVVMETDHAGLDACKAIREEIGNSTVRIILRTGQPGQAPEKETINKYDIDGYLAKANLDATRLYSSVRTALKAWQELVTLQRYQHSLSVLHDRAVALHSYDPLEITLAHILEAALEICPSSLGVVALQTFAEQGDSQSFSLYLSTATEDEQVVTRVRELETTLSRDPTVSAMTEAQRFADGVVVPLRAHHDLGSGWLFLAAEDADSLSLSGLTVLAGHAANAIYSSVAEQLVPDEDELADTLVT